MQIIRGSYGGRRTAIGYLRLCSVRKKRMESERASERKERLLAAVEKAKEEILLMRKHAEDSVGEEHGEIFGVYHKILENEGLISAITERLFKGASPDAAIEDVTASDELADGGEFSRRHIKESMEILKNVLEDMEYPQSKNSAEAYKNEKPGRYIYVSDGESSETLISVLKEYSVSEEDGSMLVGAVCSCATELKKAMSMGLPAIMIAPDSLPSENSEGITAILDCDRKRLILDPDLSELERYSEKAKASDRRSEKLNELVKLPAVTARGREIVLFGVMKYNESGDVRPTVSEIELSGGQKGGLFFSDGLLQGEEKCEEYYSSDEFEDTQYKIYRRLSALGADITVRLFERPCAQEHYLLGEYGFGLMGAGLFELLRPVYKTQLRAIMRGAGEGRLSLLLPNVNSTEEMRQLRSMIHEVKNDLKKDGITFREPERIGIELSTPLSLCEVSSLIEECDFAVVDIERSLSLITSARADDPVSADLVGRGIKRTVEICGEAIGQISEVGKRAAVVGLADRMPEIICSLIDHGAEIFYLPSDTILQNKEKVIEYDK